ncbi:single-stranded-DNA-specific exonuclease RecJ [bacterium]|nr:single-stranded-DNA-specific exonuclease RecJ [bacterium]
MSLKSKKKWVWPKKRVNTTTLIKTILKLRGVEDEKDFLQPTLENIPDFHHLHDSIGGARDIVKAIKEGKKIVIHGDYDADGICATALLWEFLYKELAKFLDTKIDVLPYIPDRTDQGYGLTESSIEDCIKLGAQMIISVDCGVRDKELINKYIKKISFVITDHHQPPEDILDNLSYPLVHQRYPKHNYSDEEVCGAHVAFILTQAIKAEVGMDTEITLETRGLDLVALATVTDIMTLKGVNRTIVKYGLEQMKKGSRVGLNSLIEKAQIDTAQLDTYHFGFVLGPRINASGRIGSALDSVKLLVSNDTKICNELSSKLDNLNFERQKLTKEALNVSKEMVDDKKKIICILGDDWHEGIVGLIAGKLNEEFSKPTLVVTQANGEIKGSARSIKGFNITNALEKCKEHLARFGGHEMAGGFTVKEGKWEEFKSCMEEIAEKEITEEMLIPTLNIDLFLSTDDLSFELVKILEQLEPFGYGNRKPILGIKELVVVNKQIMGKMQNHMKLLCKGDGVDMVTIIMFRCESDIKEIEVDNVIDVVGSVNVNSWNGSETIQLITKEWKNSV